LTTDTPHPGHLIGGEMITAVAGAHQASAGWRDTPAAERASRLLAAAKTAAGAAGDLAPLLVREHGGGLGEVQTDFVPGAGVLQHAASLVADFSRPVTYEGDQSHVFAAFRSGR
jgi:acyl-CoA reductase-like NAD-dependent aldehyde dehydrogenase